MEHDEVAKSALPEWARAPGGTSFSCDDGRVWAVPEGLVLARGARFSAVPWTALLTTIRIDDPKRLLIAAPRRPPHPPWYEVTGDDLDRLESAVAARTASMDAGSYREQRVSRAPLSPAEVRAAVLARQPLPGELVIPAPARKGSYSIVGGALVGGSVGALAFPLGWAAVAGAAAVSAISGVAIAGGLRARSRRRPMRVLVLTPDAFVGGLDGRAVRAVAWTDIERFESGADGSGQPALVVVGHDGRILVRVSHRFFGVPLDVIVSVAEAYRKRAVSA